jgi:hypothetical protein
MTLIAATELTHLHEKLAAAAHAFQTVATTVDGWVPRWGSELIREGAYDLTAEERDQILAALDRAIADAETARAAFAASAAAPEPPQQSDAPHGAWRNL